MKEAAMKKLMTSTFLLLIAACDQEPQLVPPGEEHPAVTQARQSLPTVLELHSTVISRSCSPTGGVCHNGREYPDLRTVGSLIAALEKPCNKDRFFDEPESIFDGCEPEADELVVGDGANEWRTKIGYLGPEEYDQITYTSFRHLVVAEEAPRLMNRAPARIVRNGETLVNLPSNLLLDAAKNAGSIVDTYNLDYASIRSLGYVRGGDPNGNGAFGASEPWQLVAPGHPDRSYLLGRIIGGVPGSRMPLANDPLTDAEYVAIVCWIETLGAEPSAHDAIDYDACRFAKDPQSYAIGN
jgi:hypothetical protein